MLDLDRQPFEAAGFYTYRAHALLSVAGNVLNWKACIQKTT